jgi:hypothetical protein
LQQNVDDNWDFFSAALSGHYNKTEPHEQQVKDTTRYLKKNMLYGA